MSKQQKVWRSETEKCRERLAKYCEGNGVDLGYGGDPIVPHAITVDKPQPYYSPGCWKDPSVQNLKGDARSLHWFRDECLDFVYSSHLFEDFEENEMIFVLFEWLRVLKPLGKLILYCPDEQEYRANCEKTGGPPNPNHKVENFSLDYFKREILSAVPESFYTIQHECELVDKYSFEIVLFKKRYRWRYQN